MISRFGCAPRKPDLSIAQFQEHWRTSHAKVIGQLVGLDRYWQNHAVLRDGETILPWPGFDACAQIDAQSMVDMDRAFLSPHYQGAGREDERRFINHTGFGMTLCERVLADGRVDGSGVRLLTFLRLAPMRAPAALAEAKAMIKVYEKRAPLSLKLLKRAVYGGMQMDLASAIEYESFIVTTIYQTKDRLEGINAFLEKREAKFQGN